MQRDDDEPYSTRFGDPLGRYSLPSEPHPQDDGLPAGAAEEDTDAALHRLFGNDGLASNEVVDAFGHDTVNGAQAAIDPSLQEHQDTAHREQQHQQQGHTQHAGDQYGETGGSAGHQHGYGSAEGSMHSRGGSPAAGSRHRAQDDGTGGDGTDADGGVTKKRKASSRANMLTRGGACDYCKRRKLKCSAELPSCNQCLRSGKECVYSQKKQQSRVKVLEDRLVELERRLGEQRAANGDGPIHASSDMTGHMDHTGGFGAGTDFSLDLASSAAMDKSFSAAAAAAAGPYAPFNIDGAGDVLPLSGTGSTGFFDTEQRITQPSAGTSMPSTASATPSNPFQGLSATTAIRDPAGLILDTSQPLYDLRLSLPGLRFSDSPDDVHSADTAAMNGHRTVGPEPDLMTLADAAAADGSGRPAGPAGKYEWDNMPPEHIAASLARAVQGGHGVGEKILAHLIPFYCTAECPLFTHFHRACDPKLYVARLRTGRPSTPHPSLTLSLLPFLLQYSPSPALSAPLAITTISSLLLGPARALTSHAFASGDARVIDVVTSNLFRSVWLYHSARFLDGWIEASGGATMVWAAGLGKLGNVSQGLLPREPVSPEENERNRMEGSIRAFRPKTQVVRPASTLQEHAARIQLFWEVYHYSLAGAIGWDFPASFDLDEITTPWPRDSYDDAEAFRNESSIAEFLRSPAKGAENDPGTAMLFKTLTLLYKATRLCDQPPGSETTKQRSEELLHITERYMSAMPKPPGIPADRFFSGPILQSWLTIYATLTTLHARDEAEAPEGQKERHFALCMAAMQNAVKHTHVQQTDYADPDLDGFNLLASMLFGVVGRTAYRLARRFQAAKDPASKRKHAQLTAIGEAMIKAASVMGAKSPFSATYAGMIENASVGVDNNIGEYPRPDFNP